VLLLFFLVSSFSVQVLLDEGFVELQVAKPSTSMRARAAKKQAKHTRTRVARARTHVVSARAVLKAPDYALPCGPASILGPRHPPSPPRSSSPSTMPHHKQRGFADAHCMDFEDTPENKLSYTGAFNEYAYNNELLLRVKRRCTT